MINLKQITPTFGDCSAGYAVLMDHTYTVREFIQEILSSKKNEWGYIGIAPKKPERDWCSIWGDPKCKYEHGKLTSNLPEELMDKKIHYVRGHGGWSNMDYLIFFQAECNTKKHDTLTEKRYTTPAERLGSMLPGLAISLLGAPMIASIAIAKRDSWQRSGVIKPSSKSVSRIGIMPWRFSPGR